MPTTAAIRRRRALQKRGIGMPGDNRKILEVARSLRDRVDAPVLGGVRIHTVTPEDAGHKVEQTSIIDGVRVVSLKDLIAIKLMCGFNNTGRSKDIGDVEELIRAIPLDKRFASKLPPHLRATFKKLVDGVRANDRRSGETRF